MEMNTQGGTDQNLARWRSYISGQLSSGTDPSAIAKRLSEMGVSESEAQQMVLTVQGQVAVSSKGEALVSTAIPMAIIGGVLAALVGGAIWGFVVKLTGYEIGYMAIGIGALCGGAVLLFTGGKRGVPLQIIAVLCSLLGIVLGQYSAFFFIVKAEAPKHGLDLSALPYFSMDTFHLFTAYLKELFSPFQILWIILAIGASWRILNSDTK